FQEYLIDSPETPEYAKSVASPSVFVNGKDVAEDRGSHTGKGCRVYYNDGKYEGVPSAESIVAAIQSVPQGNRMLSSLPAAAGSGLSLIPVVACPACWPAYTALLAALGVPFFTLDAAWLTPFLFFFLLLALGFLFFKAKTRRGYGPFWLGVAGVCLIAAGRLLFTPLLYLGSPLLIAAALWNAWPLKSKTPSCPACDVKKKEV
ncbi:MAG: MerC domain-containing protein, partial [Deltaproteobacteria bacterium]|nr:MerC domain-containing protein [Deltaproteobacteria bacterium]